MTSYFKRLIIICLCLQWAQAANAEALFEDTHPPEELIKALQSGGYIIYMRHGITTRKDKHRNKQMVDLNRCETQRNLTDEGILQVKHLGKVISALGIPIGKVKSSPYCRTKDTARNVFGDFEVDQKLAFSIGKEEQESARLGQYLFDSMLTSKDQQKNTVFVGHTANLKDGLGIWPKPEGVSVIFQASGDKVIYKGMIKPSEWPSL